jgi:hypothetical protein
VTVVVVSFENFERMTFGTCTTHNDESSLSMSKTNNTDLQIVAKKRNPQMNNTHTSGLIKDNRKIIGINQFRSGLSTPTGNVLERSLRSMNNSLEVSKVSESQ